MAMSTRRNSSARRPRSRSATSHRKSRHRESAASSTSPHWHFAQERADGGICIDAIGVDQGPSDSAVGFNRVHDRHVVWVRDALEAAVLSDDNFVRPKYLLHLGGEKLIPDHREALGEATPREVIDRTGECLVVRFSCHARSLSGQRDQAGTEAVARGRNGALVTLIAVVRGRSPQPLAALALSPVPGSRHRGVRQRVCNRKAVGRDHLEPPECENQQCDDDQEDYAHRSMPSLPTSIPDIEMRAGDERMLALCLRRYHPSQDLAEITRVFGPWLRASSPSAIGLRARASLRRAAALIR